MGNALEERGHKVYYIGQESKIESKELNRLKKDFIAVECSGFKPKKCLTFTIKMQRTIRALKKEIKEKDIDLVIGFGGALSFALSYSGWSMKIPVLIHEQNFKMGQANRLASVFSTRVITSYEKTNMGNRKVTFIGNPLMTKCKSIEPSMTHYDTIIVMGSLGSTSVNEIVKDYLEIKKTDYKILVIIGHNHKYQFMDLLNTRDDVCIKEYSDDLVASMKNCELIVCRSGASTLAEIASCRLPAILIPSPYVKNNHQLQNAKHYSRWGAARIIEEKDLSGKRLKSAIENLLSNKKLLTIMSQQAEKEIVDDVLPRFIELIEKYGKNSTEA